MRKRTSWLIFPVVFWGIVFANVSGYGQDVAVPAEIVFAGDLLVKTVDGVEYRFRYCPAGTFMMGEDSTAHRVTLTKGFWMLETEVTQAMWESVMGNNPSEFKGAQNPVECVSWDKCQEFCRKLSQKLGGSIKLPTEAQWEYACRAGTTTPFNFGSTLNGDKANCNGNYPYGTSTKGTCHGKTVAVKSYAPNAWGLYDMHGNVWEWCQDWYGDYPTNSVTDPTGPNSGSNHVDRGGSWNFIAEHCRSACRNISSPEYRGYYLGLRVLLEQ
ncbi:MAG: formylglycine-generating enzyme family protein [Planctomycetia bacterium]|nr:formylglycine-generating enzyme family protein [Planctomycetia bacterium]